MHTSEQQIEPAGAEGGVRDLLQAVTTALRILGSGGDEVAALKESFEQAARGFHAEKALLLRVMDREPLRLEALHSWGLTFDQVKACVDSVLGGEAVRGVSPSTIRAAIDTRQVQLVENSQSRSRGEQTASLLGAPHSVLCAPVLDPWTGAPLAALYFQTVSLSGAYGKEQVAILESHATALGHAFGFHLTTERRYRDLEADWRRLQQSGADAPELIGESEEIWRLKQLLRETYLPHTGLKCPAPLLVLGPTGAGKDLVAQYLHYYSPVRRKGKFIAYNCAAVRGEISQAVLFGHTKGAFTGATEARPGLFRAANGGTLFLDEIGELPLESQALLFRVLGNWKVLPLGATEEVPVDVQVVAATNQDLPQLVREGRFREELYQRIKPLTVRLSPLSARPGDIRPLLSHFLAQAERRAHKKIGPLTPAALRLLLSYRWPGNVRELAGACTALVTYARPGQPVDVADVERYCDIRLDGAAHVQTSGDFHEARSAWERGYLLARLEEHGWDVHAAAEELGIHAATLYRYLQRHGLRKTE